MARRFRLAAVLRARKAQEDAAKSAMLHARLAAFDATEEEMRRSSALDSRPEPPSQLAPAFVAALAARQAMAGEIAVAARLTAEADAVVLTRASDLTAAAIRRRTLERMAERQAAAADQAEQRADQQALDEIAATRPARNAQSGDDA
jgi:flagellar FliJ protein